MNRKSQLTLFIIIGIIMLFSAAIIIYLQQQVETAGFTEDEISRLPTEIQPIKLFVDNCLEEVAIPGIYYMGTQGGYIDPPLKSLLTETAFIPYYYNNRNKDMPSTETLENEIAQYIEATLPICTNQFDLFPDEIVEEEPRATVRINNQNVLVQVFYPITVVSDGREQRIENFLLEVPIRLGHIYDVAEQVIERQVEDPELLDLAFLASFDVSIDILPYDGRSNIFAITDARSTFEDIPYQLFFANKYGFNTAPELTFAPDFIIPVNVPFEHQFTAVDLDDDILTFTDDTQLFEINAETGVVAFTPAALGTVEATITVSDGEKEDSELIIFEIR